MVGWGVGVCRRQGGLIAESELEVGEESSELHFKEPYLPKSRTTTQKRKTELAATSSYYAARAAGDFYILNKT